MFNSPENQHTILYSKEFQEEEDPDPLPTQQYLIEHSLQGVLNFVRLPFVICEPATCSQQWRIKMAEHLFCQYKIQGWDVFSTSWDGVSLKTPRPRGWVGAGRPSGCKSSFNKRNMYQYPHVSQLFILLPWQSRVYLEPLKVVEFVQLTTECCWGQPSDPCQRGCLTSHACVMWGPRTLNADDDDDDATDFDFHLFISYIFKKISELISELRTIFQPRDAWH